MYSLIASNGVVYGPVDINQLVDWAHQGRVDANSLIIDHTLNQTLPAAQTGGLTGLFPSPISAPPPQLGGAAYRPLPYGNPSQNYHVAPRYRASAPKQMLVAALFAFFLGGLGIHQFYLGKTGLGITMLLITVLTCGYGGIFTGIWALIDFIIIVSGSATDANGQRLV